MSLALPQKWTTATGRVETDTGKAQGSLSMYEMELRIS